MEWRDIEKEIGSIPPCLKVLLNATGYDSFASIIELSSEKICELEQYITSNGIVGDLECCHSQTYKNQKKFAFLPGHRTILKTLPETIKKINSDRQENLNLNHRSVVLNELIKCSDENAQKNKNQAQYSQIIKDFFTYIYLLGGKNCYETLKANLPIPSTKTIRKFDLNIKSSKVQFIFVFTVRQIESNEQRVTEGQLRCRELKTYLEQLGAEKVVWLSEDATQIIQKISYDAITNQIVGLVLPLGSNGCPVTLSYEAKTEDAIKEHMKKQKSSIAYVVMAQPLNQNLPPFVLQLFGSGNSFTTENVLNRWQHTQNELLNHGIKIAGISSDGDPRLLSAMSYMLSKQVANSALLIAFIQDLIHLATKLRNRLLKLHAELLMGTEKVTVKHLIALINCCSKEIHGLNLTDVSPDDRQNFASFEKIVTPRALDALKKYVPESKGTAKYLELANDVVSSYIEFDLTPTERIIRNYRATYFFRIWKEHIRQSKHKMEEKFITPNAFKCIEINARYLLMLIRKFRDENTPHLFLPTLYNSQTCENVFRQFRSMGTMNFTKINFSILELLYMIRRVETQNNILHFRLKDKGVMFPKFQVLNRETKVHPLPSDEEIKSALLEAKTYAVEDAKKFGMVINDDLLENYPFNHKSKKGFENIDEDVDCLEDLDDDVGMDEILDEVSGNSFMTEDTESDRRFVEVSTEDGLKKMMRKSSLVWLLSEKGMTLSKDRLKRVQSTSVSSKRARK